MIVRALFRLLVVCAVLFLGWLLGRALAPLGARKPLRPTPPGSPAPGESLVRDRICNTFLPRSRALWERREGEEYFYCSEACRQADRATHPAPTVSPAS